MSIPSIEPSPEPSDEASLYNLRKKLFKVAMNRKWKEVVELYRHEKVQGEHITRANDTLLHVAVSGATEEVLDILNIVEINKEKMCEILSLKNKNGDTPLHLAAALGLEKVSRRMTKMCPHMVTSTHNNLRETPLFSAVRHGKKNAFFVLEVAIHKEQDLKIHEEFFSKRDITHCKRYDDNNILHYAIKGKQFDLADEIIHLYPALLNDVNSSRETALHTLANKPSVFKSGARFGLYDTIIYYCTITEPLKFQFVNFLENEKNEMEKQSDIRKDENNVVPPMYKVCIDLFSMMKASISCIFSTVAFYSKTGIDEENPGGAQKEDEGIVGAQKRDEYWKHKRWFPPNYDIIIFFFKIIVGPLLVVLGIGLRRLQRVKLIKQEHRNAKEIMKELVDRSTHWEYKEATDGEKLADSPLSPDIGSKSRPMIISRETTDSGFNKKTPHASPVLVAAKRGITEMVKRILKKYPEAVNDKDKDNKNIVLLAVEHRQIDVYTYMLDVPTTECVFQEVDKDDNSVLHIAAMFSHNHPWSSGAALQMNWEFKWYKYVDSTITRYLDITSIINKDGKMPHEVFIQSHDTLMKDGIKWLTNISQSCSTVAALFATVTFASVSAFPGGPDQQSGIPIFSKAPAFQLFTVSSLVALCFSVTSLLMFLAILTSSFKVRDFERGVPMKLILGLTSLFVAIASSLVSFCAGDLFVVKENLKLVVYPIYAVMFFAFTFFAIAHYPLCIDLIEAIIKKAPEHTGKIYIYYLAPQ